MGCREEPVTPWFHQHFGWFVPAVCTLALSLSPLHAAEFYNDWAATHLSSVPSQNGPTNDPDSDGVANLAEFVFGTDPLVSGGLGNVILPRDSGTDGVFAVEVFEQAGHKPGVQLDLDATADMTHWIRPWWLRTLTNSQPGDPTNSVRELFTTCMPSTNAFIVRGVLHLFDAGPETANYYVATNGSDTTGNGSINNPYATLAKAVSVATTGNLIYVRGGTYPTSAKLSLSRSGSATQPIRIRAYPGETPVFDCSSTPVSTDYISISGNYWYLYGLVITNSGHNSITISGNYNTLERCVSYGARNTGINISGGNGATIYPSNNLVLNCDSIHSYDAVKYGSDADGFSAKYSLGNGNVFRGCRSWENSDDGWDLWMGSAPVLIDNCWAFRNGIDYWGAGKNFQGNGNGFKLGGSNVPASHRLVHSVAYSNVGTNGGYGIDQNNNTAALTVDQNVSWANRSGDINLNHSPNKNEAHIVRNNVVIGGSVSITGSSTQLSNSWQVISPAVTSNDFLSMDTSFFTASRRDDGSLPENPLVRPVPNGRLVDQGADLGEPFSGSAPDLGAYETPVW